MVVVVPARSTTAWPAIIFSPSGFAYETGGKTSTKKLSINPNTFVVMVFMSLAIALALVAMNRKLNGRTLFLQTQTDALFLFLYIKYRTYFRGFWGFLGV